MLRENRRRDRLDGVVGLHVRVADDGLPCRQRGNLVPPHGRICRQAGKQDLTVRQALCHEAGLYHIRHMIDDARAMLDWDRMARALAAATPRHAPGAAHGYHAFTFGWLIGEIVQRVAGKPFREVLEAELVRPLGLDGLYVGVPPDQMRRRAQPIEAASPRSPVPPARSPRPRRRHAA